MLGLLREFRIRRNEWLFALLVVVAFCLLEGLFISKFWELYADYSGSSWKVFMRNFHMSGFDPFTYNIVTRWHIGYTINRHCLLPFFVWPLAMLNKGLWQLTGVNCTQFVVGGAWLVCTLYSALFLRRLLMEETGCRRLYADVLSLFFFGFAYIMIACIVPDHFVISMMFLLLTLQRAAVLMREGRKMGMAETSVLLILTGGVTLSNAIVVLLAAWVVNGKSFWRWKPLLLYFVLCVALLGIGLAERYNQQHVKPQEMENWVDTKTPRWQSVTDNMFGEGIILHEKHLLGDVLVRRPLFVEYESAWPLVVEGCVALLFVAGLVVGIRRRFTWLMLALMGYMAALHLGLGFGLNEVYIMSAHWMFCIPLCIGYLFALQRPRWLPAVLCVAVIALSAYIYKENVRLLHYQLTKELRYK